MRIFIVALINHFNFGPLLIPYFAHQKDDGTLDIEEQVSASRKRQDLSDVEKKILDASSSYSDRNLKKTYSKEKTVSAFLKNVSQRTFSTEIRPFIDKKILEIIHLIRTNQIPLYNRTTGTKKLFSHHRIQVSENLAEALFSFELNENSFKYSIRCLLDKEEIDLHEHRPTTVLTHNPASIIGNDLLLMFNNIPANKMMPFFNRREVEVPADQAEKYMEQIVLPAVINQQVEAKGFSIVEETRERKAKLSFEVSIHQKPIILLSFEYGESLFISPAKDDRKYVELHTEDTAYTIRYFKRDLAWEKEKVNLLTSLGLEDVSNWQYVIKDDHFSIFEWINQHKEVLDQSFDYTHNTKENNLYVGEIKLIKNISEKQDWFDLHIQVQVGQFVLPFTSFSWHILHGIREYKLPDNRIMLLPEEWFHAYTDLFLLGKTSGESVQLQKNQLGIIEQVDKSIITDKYKVKTAYPIPKELKATLRDYQTTGYQWLRHLRENNFGGCLADDMGLGKTVQTIALIQSIYPRKEKQNIPEEPTNFSIDKQGQFSFFSDYSDNSFIPTPLLQTDSREDQPHATLIVAPTSVLKNWSREIRKFSSLSFFEYTGTGRIRNKHINKIFDRFQVILTTYGLLRADIDLLAGYPFELVVLDESQNIKNPDSITYKAANRLSAKQRIALTGTPIENSLKDGWAQFNFVNPGILGSFSFFKEKYMQPIEKGGDETISERLRQLIQPFMLRRTKEEVAPELPNLTEEILFCEMTEEQSEIYNKEKNSLRNRLLQMNAEGVLHKNRFAALQGILRLRQIANHPAMVDSDYTFSSGKIDIILDTFAELQEGGHKVLIFSSFTKHLALIEKAFIEKGWEYALLTGSTKNRQEVIDRFTQSREVQAFLISLKAGGVGLNLTEADYVFIIDPWWNPAAEAQAKDRAHRIGQDKHVFAYRFITLQSIEEKILALQERKSKLFESFIQSNDPLEKLTDADWAVLLNIEDEN